MRNCARNCKIPALRTLEFLAILVVFRDEFGRPITNPTLPTFSH